MFYTADLEIYAGKQPEGPDMVKNDAASIVKRIVQPIGNSRRNITMGNYLSSVALANDLYANHRLTMVRTLKKNKPEILHEFSQPYKNRPIGSSQFDFGWNQNKCTVIPYIAKKKNCLHVVNNA